jgi:hypothetical protein
LELSDEAEHAESLAPWAEEFDQMIDSPAGWSAATG